MLNADVLLIENRNTEFSKQNSGVINESESARIVCVLQKKRIHLREMDAMNVATVAQPIRIQAKKATKSNVNVNKSGIYLLFT